MDESGLLGYRVERKKEIRLGNQMRKGSLFWKGMVGCGKWQQRRLAKGEEDIIVPVESICWRSFRHAASPDDSESPCALQKVVGLRGQG